MSTLALRAAGTMPRVQFMPLTRAGVAVTAYLLAVGTAFFAWHRQADTGPLWLAALVWGTPTLVGMALAASPQRDREQYVARLVAAALMLPVLQLFLAIDGPLVAGAGLALALLGVLLHGLAFLASLRWLAAWTTRIGPAADAPAVHVERLMQRLASFAALDWTPALHLQQGPATCVLHWSPADAPGRRHRVSLRLDAVQRAVDVLEQWHAEGAAPLRSAQTTLLDATQLAAPPLSLAGDQVRWLGDGPPALADSDALMAALAGLVLRSGWRWVPRLGG